MLLLFWAIVVFFLKIISICLFFSGNRQKRPNIPLIVVDLRMPQKQIVRITILLLAIVIAISYC